MTQQHLKENDDTNQSQIPLVTTKTEDASSSEQIHPVTQQTKVTYPKTYYIPWTLIVLISFGLFASLTFPLGQALYLPFLAGSAIKVYILAIVPPIVIYRFIKKRYHAYGIHCMWFIAFAVWNIVTFHTGQEDQVLVTPHDIITYRYGFLWNSGMGNDVVSSAIAILLCAGLYAIEKTIKEKWRERYLSDLHKPMAT